MTEIFDISVGLHEGMPFWPGSAGLHLERTRDLERGDEVTSSVLRMDVHAGTHVDAPSHFLRGAAGVESLSLDALIGAAHVIDATAADVLDAALVEALLPAGCTRALFKTRNSAHWARGEGRFVADFVALTADGAAALVERGVRLVANDYLSVQRYTDGPETHERLLRAGVIVLEGVNLDGVPAGGYELLCLPLKLVGAEGAPARAVLRRLP